MDVPVAGLLSIVVPVRDEEPNVAPLCREVREALGEKPFELLFVDDGSRDGTFEAVRRARGADARVRGLWLSGRGGKAAAYTAGFEAARGEWVATMDGDLQDDPRDLSRLLEGVRGGTDLVVGWKRTGKSSPATFVLSRLVNGLLRLVVRPKLHDMNCPLRVMHHGVAKGLELRADHHRYIPMLAAAAGYSVREMPVANRERVHGRSKYGGSKYWSSATALLGVGLYLRFGQRPMALFGGLGLVALVSGTIVCGTVAAYHIAFGTDIDDDVPTLILGAILLIAGLQFLGLGLLAEIVVRRIRVSTDAGRVHVAEEA